MASRPDLEESEEFWSDLKNPDLSKRFIMERWNCSSSFVVDRRRAIGFKKAVVTSTAPSTSKSAGESEQHNPDGSSSYTRYSERPWGEEDFRKFLLERGTDPDSVTFTFGWTSNPAGGFWNKLNNVRKKPEAASVAAFPLSHFYAEARKTRSENRPVPSNTERGTVVVISDWQIGKTGRRGGTTQLLARLENALLDVEAELQKRTPGRILLLDGGDGIENFESGGNPMFTNDLSLPDQLDCYATELLKFVRLCTAYAETEVGVVPSNHSAWRRGKQNLGNPSDDFGVFTHKQVAKHFNDGQIYRVPWRYADEYDESLCVDFMGTQIGLVHGNQFAPGKAIDWWQGQAFGDQAISKADVLVSAHYHSFGAGVAGQNPFSGRERMWLGAPTLDSGSDWYRNIKGRDSLPGTMIFDVTSTGFDLSSLTIV